MLESSYSVIDGLVLMYVLNVFIKVYDDTFFIFSSSLSINIASVSAYLTDLSSIPSVGRLVHVSVCMSEKCIVVKRLIGSACRLG